MAKRSTLRSEQMRQAVAKEAARIMAQQSLADFYLAKHKAAQRLGAPEKALPSNREIEEALVEYQRLFGGDEHLGAITKLRQAAFQAMKMLAQFNPQLVGPVLTGTANTHSEVQLHLFTDTPEQVALALLQHDIPYHSGERQMRYAGDRNNSYPCFVFMAGDVGFEIVTFPTDAVREAPLSPVDGKPMHRARTAEVQALTQV